VARACAVPGGGGYRTAAQRPKARLTLGIAERFHTSLLEEFDPVAFRRNIYRSIEALQTDLDAWIKGHDEERPYQGHWCFGKTPMQTFKNSLTLAKEKLIAA